MKTNVPTYGLYGEASEAVHDFWIHTESIPARASRHNWEIGGHRHDHFYQILFVRGGMGDAEISASINSLTPGTFVFVPEKTTHGYRFSRDIDGLVITLLSDRLPMGEMSGGRLRAFLTEPKILHLPLDEDDGFYLSSTLLRIDQELAAGFGARDHLVEALLTVALTLASELDASSHIDETASDRDAARIGRLNQLIGNHFREHLTVEFYARELGVSVTHLNRITKARTGRTMNELLSDKIIQQAKRDLLFTTQTAQEIAYALGFADPAYFTRFFSRGTGDTPRHFRERERGRQVKPKSVA